MSYSNRASKIFEKIPEVKTGFVCDYSSEFLHTDGPFYVKNSIGYSKTSAPCYDIYFKEIGLIPNYAGHVPGAKFKYGKTFGSVSVDAKSYIQFPTF